MSGGTFLRTQTQRRKNMPGTVDDFMQRFGGAGTMDESEAAQYHDRFVSNHANDREFDNNTYHEAATQDPRQAT